MYIYIYRYIYTYIHTYIHTYIYIHTHTHTHTYVYAYLYTTTTRSSSPRRAASRWFWRRQTFMRSMPEWWNGCVVLWAISPAAPTTKTWLRRQVAPRDFLRRWTTVRNMDTGKVHWMALFSHIFRFLFTASHCNPCRHRSRRYLGMYTYICIYMRPITRGTETLTRLDFSGRFEQ